jgi:Flp pilus assembly pilin Flp
MTFASIADLLADDGAVTLVEYGIILALLSAVGIVALEATATGAGTVLNNQQTGFDTVQSLP